MSLSRSKPLRADRTHSWETQADMGAYRLFRCSRCHSHRRVRRRADLPEKWCNGLKRSELERTSRLSPVSRSNSGREHQKDLAYREWIRDLPCILQRSGSARCEGRIDPAHVKNWGAGWGDFIEIVEDGEAVRVGNIVPLCRKHHRLSENEPGWGPETFEKHYGIDLAGEARRLGERGRGRE